MTLQGGDRQFGHGDQMTVENNHGSTINEGEWLAVNGDGGDHPQVALADVNGAGDLMAVAAESFDDGALEEAKFRGAPWARVDSGVTAGDELGAPDSSGTGTPGVAVSGGSSGHYALTDATQLPDGNYYAVVALD